MDFLVFSDDAWVRYILSRIHDELFWLDVPYMITKDANKAVTGMCSTRTVPILKSVKNNIMMQLIDAKFDKKGTNSE